MSNTRNEPDAEYDAMSLDELYSLKGIKIWQNEQLLRQMDTHNEVITRARHAIWRKEHAQGDEARKLPPGFTAEMVSG